MRIQIADRFGERERINQRDVHAEKDGLQLWLEADVVQRFRADYDIFPLADLPPSPCRLFHQSGRVAPA
jgi:hypothetical protein